MRAGYDAEIGAVSPRSRTILDNIWWSGPLSLTAGWIVAERSQERSKVPRALHGDDRREVREQSQAAEPEQAPQSLPERHLSLPSLSVWPEQGAGRHHDAGEGYGGQTDVLAAPVDAEPLLHRFQAGQRQKATQEGAIGAGPAGGPAVEPADQHGEGAGEVDGAGDR